MARAYERLLLVMLCMHLFVLQRCFDGFRGELINKGKRDLALRRAHSDEADKKPLLCVSFLKASQAALANIRNNSRVLPCDFALVFYDMRDNASASAICALDFSPLTLLHCLPAALTLADISTRIARRSASSKDSAKHLYAPALTKTLMYFDVLPYLQLYRHVLVFDQDISFVGYDIQAALRIWQCSSRQPALIAQPLIHGRRVFPFLHESFWEGRNGRPLAHSTAFIEQQTPLFDAEFFHWLINAVIREAFDLHLYFGSSWGPDTLWCQAAVDYGRYVLKYGAHYQHACVIITGLKGVRHLDSRTINRNNSWGVRNRYVYSQYQLRFPFWKGGWQMTTVKHSNWAARKLLPNCSVSLYHKPAL